MKVLIDHNMPFWLAHGGLQIQIEQTRAALEEIGVEVDYARWWDESQRAGVIHYFGRPPIAYVEMAQGKGMRVVVAELLTQTASRSPRQLVAQKTFIQTARKFIPGGFTTKLGWDVYQKADAFIALNSHEARLMNYLFGADPKKVHVIYNGVEKAFFEPAKETRGQWLVCTATITERKRVVELARAAAIAKTPVWILGKPYSESDPYMAEFRKCVQSAPEIVRFEGPVSDRARLAEIYRQARGFVLLSDCESLSLSALEAAACGCPLLLSDLPWARSVFEKQVRYAPAFRPPSEIAPHLRRFYDDAPGLKPPFKPPTWIEIAEQIRGLYQTLLR